MGGLHGGERSRTISPDPTIPNVNNPQALNRFSYVANNPLKCVDPSGLDWVFVAGQSQKSATQWLDFIMNIYNSGVVGSDEHMYFIPDTTSGFGVSKRVDLLAETLVDNHCTNIKLVGFSEGAATVGAFLDKLATHSKYLEDSSIRKELKMAILMEALACPGAAGLFSGYTDNTLKNLPSRMVKADINIQLGYIYNDASIVATPVPEGWDGKTYSYTSYHPWALINPIWPVGVFQFFSENHSDILHNQYTVSVIVDLARSIK